MRSILLRLASVPAALAPSIAFAGPDFSLLVYALMVVFAIHALIFYVALLMQCKRRAWPHLILAIFPATVVSFLWSCALWVIPIAVFAPPSGSLTWMSLWLAAPLLVLAVSARVAGRRVHRLRN